MALEIFQIEQFVLVEEVRPIPRKLSKPRKNRILSSSTIENTIDSSKTIIDSIGNENANITCPYTECLKKFKEEKSFLNHLCLVHHKNELESKIIKLGGKFKCPHNGCNLDSENKSFVISHFGVRHNKILPFLAKTFPEHNVLLNNT